MIALAFIMCILSQADAMNSTFTVHGVIIDENGTPLKDAAVELVDFNDVHLQNTTTDSLGRFDFIDANSTTENCSLRIVYADNNSYIMPANYYRVIPASGVQYVNITRLKANDYKPEPDMVGNMLESWAGSLLALIVTAIILSGWVLWSRKKKQ